MLENASLKQRTNFEERMLERCARITTAEEVAFHDHRNHRKNFPCSPVKHLSNVLEKSVKAYISIGPIQQKKSLIGREKLHWTEKNSML